MLATDPSTDSLRPPAGALPPPWWRFRIMWLVWGLPATVVVASLFSAGIAWRHIDPLVTDTRPSHALGAEDLAEHGQPTSALEPAERARNHAATPGR